MEVHNNTRCLLCHSSENTTISSLIFSCSHIKCENCLYRFLLKDYLHLLGDNLNAEATFKCCDQSIEIPLSKVEEILLDLNKRSTHFEDLLPKLCLIHQMEVDTYCADCKFEACSLCNINEHSEHTIYKSTSLKEHLKRIPSTEYLNLDDTKETFHKEFNNKLQKSCLAARNKNQTDEKATTEVFQDFKELLARADLVLSIIELLYKKFYCDIRKPLTDIIELIFLNQIRLLRPIIKIQSVEENQMNMKIYITFEEVPLLENNITSTSLILPGHTKWITSLIQLADGRIASGSADCHIKIWKVRDDTFTCTQTLTEHQRWISALVQLKDGKLVSGSYDKTIKIWGISQNNFICTFTLTGHSNTITSLIQLNDGRLASGSFDKTIKIWGNKFSFSDCQILADHTDRVDCLIQLEDGRIASGSSDTTIRIWEAQDGQSFHCSSTLTGTETAVTLLLQLNDLRIVSGSRSSMCIRIWDNTTCTHVLSLHDDFVLSLIQLKDGRLISGSCDTSIKIWKIRENILICTRTLIGHSDWITSLLELKDGRLMSGSSDITIRIWK